MTDMPSPPPGVIMTMRLWREPLDSEESEWRGEIKNLTTGEMRYFRGEEEMAAIVTQLLANMAPTRAECDIRGDD